MIDIDEDKYPETAKYFDKHQPDLIFELVIIIMIILFFFRIKEVENAGSKS